MEETPSHAAEKKGPARKFLEKIAGTMFRAPETFETLIGESFRTALSYALILFAFFLLVKSSVFLLWQDPVNRLLGALNPSLSSGTEISLLLDASHPLNFPEIFFFYIALVTIFLSGSIILSHIMVMIHQSRIGTDAFRTPPDLRQTATVVLNSSASLFLPGAIPGIGLVLGFTWFSITVDEGMAAHYGKNRRKGFFFSYYYPSFDWHGGAFIMIFWVGLFLFGMMAYRIILFW